MPSIFGEVWNNEPSEFGGKCIKKYAKCKKKLTFSFYDIYLYIEKMEEVRMKWLGEKLKNFVESRYRSQDEFCNKIRVSRQSFSSWVNEGNIPNGKLLLAIAVELQISIADLFEDTIVASPQFMPAHNALVNQNSFDEANALAEEYSNIISNDSLVFSQVCELSTDKFKQLSKQFRAIAGIDEISAMTYGDVFKLAHKLGICIIFRKFSNNLSEVYAFHRRINGVPVIFVDTESFVPDLIFVLLHEICHSVRRNNDTEETEDDFCNKVADLAQFPDNFLNKLQMELNQADKETQKNIIVKYARDFSVLGLYKSFERRGIEVNWHYTKDQIKAISSSINNCIGKIGNILSPGTASEKDVCLNYYTFSLLFFKEFLLPNLENMTARFVAQIFDLSNGEDGQALLEELKKLRDSIK